MNDEKLHIINIWVEYKIIVIFQYTIEEYVSFVFQYHKNYNKKINHLLSWFLL